MNLDAMPSIYNGTEIDRDIHQLPLCLDENTTSTTPHGFLPVGWSTLRGQFLNPMDPAEVGILERVEKAVVSGPEIALQNLGQHKVITFIS